MNQNPNRNQRPTQGYTYDPKKAAARQAYIRRRKREIRRNRIILGVAAALILILLGTAVFFIVRGISSAIGDGGKDTENAESQQLPPSTDSMDDASAGSDNTPDDTEEPEPTYTLNFRADLSDYEKYMDPKEGRDDYLVLVNPDNPLPDGYVPEDLVEVSGTRKDGRAMQQMQRTAAKALEALFTEAHAEGIMSAATPSGYPLSVTSAYRSYTYQNTLFNSYVDREMANNKSMSRAEAEAYVETYSCRPGTSEHQTGLCCDMHTLSGADISFAKEEQATWLAENAWKFGFILRFPKDKTGVTGISYEPWHFRFVGRYHAYKIHSQGLCLEEYIATLDK